MSRMWHYQQEKTSVGPVSEIEIRELISSKKLSPEDFVWHKDLPVWTKVKETALMEYIPTAPPSLEKRSDVPAEKYETRSITEKLLHGFTCLMAFWGSCVAFGVFCILLGGNINGTGFAFWGLFVGFFSAKGIGGWIWSMPRAKRIRLSIAISVGVPTIILGTAKIINSPNQ